MTTCRRGGARLGTIVVAVGAMAACLPPLAPEALIQFQLVSELSPQFVDAPIDAPQAVLESLALLPGQTTELRALAPLGDYDDALLALDRVAADGDVLSVELLADEKVRVIASKSGRTTLRGAGTVFDTSERVVQVGDDALVLDAVSALPIFVGEPEQVTVALACAEQEELLLPAGQNIVVPHAMQTAAGTPGPYTPVAVDVDPPEALTLAVDDRFRRAWTGTTAAQEGEFVLRAHGVDTVVARARLVTAGAIDGAALDTSEPVAVNVRTARRLQPLVGGLAVCQMRLATVVTPLSREICNVTLDPLPPAERGDECDYARDGICKEGTWCPEGTDATDCRGGPVLDVDAWGILHITGHTAGTCRFRVNWPDARGGAGLSESFSVVIE